jgi:hypothetical protein
MAIEELAALDAPPTCRPRGEWCEAAVTEAVGTEAGAAEASAATVTTTLVSAPLLGDVRRRSTRSAALEANAPAEVVRTALTSQSAVHAVALSEAAEGGASAEAAVATATGARDGEAAVEVDASEEVAVRIGYLDHVEDEFWRSDEDEDWMEDDDEDDDEAGPSSEFWEQWARLRTEQEDRSQGPGVGNEI